MVVVRWVVCLLALAGALACGTREDPSGPTTVLLISVDSLRADRLGVYGADLATPAIDVLARESLVFEAAWSPAPLTLPAHASMLTGLPPPGHGVRVNGGGPLPEQVSLVSEAFRRGGFRTAAVIGALPLHRRSGLARGFDHYDDELPAGAAGVPERRASKVAARALAWLRGQPPRQPVFLFVHLYDPHAPYDPPAPFAERHADRPYDGEVASVDAAVAALRAGLDEHGRWREAIVVLVADHGESLGEHGEQTHGLLLSESVLRVPFLVRAPGLTPARTRDPVSLVDVAPTLLALAGVSPSAAVEGVDVTGTRDAGRDLYAETLAPFFDHGWSGLRAIRRRGMKLIDGPSPELYDVPDDPAEARNLWPSPAGEALRTALHRLAGRLGQRGIPSDVPRDFGLDRPDPRSKLDVVRELDAIACLPPESAPEAARRLDALARREPGSHLIRRRLAEARSVVGERAQPSLRRR